MREIKFRGKREDNNEWVYGFYKKKRNVHTGEYDHFITDVTYNPDTDSTYFTDHKIINGTVGEYIGLKDPYGKDVYEGDILMPGWIISYCDGMSIDVFLERKVEVGWHIAENNFNGAFEAIFYKDNLEILGNIHDNPELAY